MIRTRDFLLYVLLLVFLVSSIGYTVFRDVAVAQRSSTNDLASIDTANLASTYSVVVEESSTNRETYIAEMRKKIANGEGVIPNAPVVLTSVDEGDALADGDSVTDRSVTFCDNVLDVSSIRNSWQKDAIEITTVEGARIVTETKSHTSGTSTEMIREPRIQLPIRANSQDGAHCIPHDIVGIGLDGSLLLLADAYRFSSYGSDILIGYALDGFPIYGPTTDITRLDACGGNDDGAGYRYHIRTAETFILACFTSPSATFIR